jgi:uncharacterized membrane protein
MTLIEKYKLAYLGTLGLLICLVIFMSIETLIYTPSTLHHDVMQAKIFIIIVKSAPLLLFIPALLAKHAMSGIWLGLVLMFYFCLAVMSSFDSSYMGTLAIIRSVLIASLFMSGMFYTRYQKQLDAQ